MARRRLLTQHRAKRRCIGSRRTLRVDFEPELPRTPGARRADPPDESDDGSGRGADRQADRCAHADASVVTWNRFALSQRLLYRSTKSTSSPTSFVRLALIRCRAARLMNVSCFTIAA